MSSQHDTADQAHQSIGYDPNASTFFVMKPTGKGESKVVLYPFGVTFELAYQKMQELDPSGTNYTIAVDACLNLVDVKPSEISRLVAAMQRTRSNAA